MKRILVAVLIALVCHTASAALPQDILGSWVEIRKEPGKNSTEFFADGTMVCVDKGTMNGKYVFVGPNTMRLTGHGPSGRQYTVDLGIWIENGFLHLKYPLLKGSEYSGKVERYQRAP